MEVSLWVIVLHCVVFVVLFILFSNFIFIPFLMSYGLCLVLCESSWTPVFTTNYICCCF